MYSCTGGLPALFGARGESWKAMGNLAGAPAIYSRATGQGGLALNCKRSKRSNFKNGRLESGFARAGLGDVIVVRGNRQLVGNWRFGDFKRTKIVCMAW